METIVNLSVLVMITFVLILNLALVLVMNTLNLVLCFLLAQGLPSAHAFRYVIRRWTYMDTVMDLSGFGRMKMFRASKKFSNSEAEFLTGNFKQEFLIIYESYNMTHTL